MRTTILGAIGVVVVLTLGTALPAAAIGTPSTTIRQLVQNQTTNSELVDANDTANALHVKPGDILKYVVEIKNTAVAADHGANDLKSAKLTDTLPAGLGLVTGDDQNLSEDMGTIKPGKMATKQFLVVVSDNATGTLTNKACFTGKYDSEDIGQSGCDDAFVVLGDSAPRPAVTTPTPQAPATATANTKSNLPTTGPSNGLVIGFVVLGSAFAYAARMYFFTRHRPAAVQAK